MTAVQGDANHNAADSGTAPVKVGGVYRSTPPTLVDGRRGDALLDANGYLRVRIGSGGTDATTGSPTDVQSNAVNGMIVVSFPDLFNGVSWDRQRNNVDTTTGDAGTKTASFNGATQTNYNARGAIVQILCGTVSGTTPTLSAQFQTSFDGGTTWLNWGPQTANLTATGQSATIGVYPTNWSQAAGVTPANIVVSGTNTTTFNNMPLPRTWRLIYTIGGTTPSFAITAVYVNYIL